MNTLVKAMTGLQAVKITTKHPKTGKVYQKTVYRRGGKKEAIEPRSALGDSVFSTSVIQDDE